MPFGLTADEFKIKATRAKDTTVSTVTLGANRLKSAPSAKAKWGLGAPPRPPPPAPDKRTKPGPAFPPPPRRSSTLTNDNNPEDEDLYDDSHPEPPPAPPAPSFGLGRPPAAPSRAFRTPIVPVQQGDLRPVAPSPPSRNRTVKAPPVAAPRRKAAVDDIDWANLSQEDKEIFFSWLDEFFATHVNIEVPAALETTNPPRVATGKSTATTKSNIPATPAPSAPTRGPPPTVAKWTKPQAASTAMTLSVSSDLVMSHPPPCQTGSSAEDLAQYFLPSARWDSPWYTSNNPIAPQLQGNRQISFAMSRRTMGPAVTLSTGVAFSDLSVCWYTVDFSTKDQNNASLAKRSARYIGRPRAMDRAALMEAHETYGETIAAFAEGFVVTGEYCARGECWDLADQAIKYFDEFDYVPKPVPSLSRTHGHLIFEGRADGKGRTQGRWRGGDDRVRRGDIVEWRNVKINVVGARAGSWTTLGNPDHTAVVVRDSKPSAEAVDGGALNPEELGTLEVVEQSVGSPPDRKVYDMAAMEKGEMWIYRPIGLEAYVGTLFEATCPPGVRAIEV